MKGLSWEDYWMSCGQPEMAHDFGAFSRAEAWALQRFHGAHQSAGEPFGWWLVDDNGIGRLSRTPPQDTIEIYRSTPGYSAIPLYDAQPSSAGQGNGLVESLVQVMNAEYDGLGRLPADVLGVLNMAVEALAARQPVAAIPAGFVLMPEKFGIPADVWEGVEFVIGGPGTGEGEAYLDSTAWIGDLMQDDGSSIYGLHLSCDECPEEGSVTLAEFAAPTVQAVDLGQFRPYVVAQLQEYESHGLDGDHEAIIECHELLALIDGKVVGK